MILLESSFLQPECFTLICFFALILYIVLILFISLESFWYFEQYRNDVFSEQTCLVNKFSSFHLHGILLVKLGTINETFYLMVVPTFDHW